MSILKTIKEMFSERKGGYQIIEAESLASLIEKNEVLLLDVREASEWEQGRIVSAYLFPMSGFNPIEIEPLAKTLNQKIVFYCRSGGRSALAATHFLEEYPEYEGQVFNLKGGMLSFSPAYPTFIALK